MSQIQENKIKYIERDIKGIVYDMSFDWFGNRIAIATDNQKISIYKYENFQWKIQLDKYDTGHHGPINKIKWAHPSLGVILATCSQDKKIKIFEEKQKILRGKNTWEIINETSFSDSIEDIKFAPKSLGFVLAAACSDGRVYILEFVKDKISNQYSVNQNFFDVAKKNISAISWNKQTLEPNMLVVGCNNPKETSENQLTLWLQKQNYWEKKHFFDFESYQKDNKEVKNIGTSIDVSWGLLNGRQFKKVISLYSKLWRKWGFCMEIQNQV